MPPAVVASVLVGFAIIYVELVLGELVPKALALRYTESIALLVSAPFRFMARASRWVVGFLAASTRLVLRAVGIKEALPRTFVSEEEIKHLVKEGRQQGVLDQTEMEIIHSVFEFTDTPVRKVMVPRPKIFALDADTPPSEVGSLIVESGFSRIPVYEGSIDQVVGVVYVKDALRLLEKRQPVVIRKILHPVHLVPETKKVGELLKELQKRRSHMAVVVDEHGSVSGLVTLEDLLEQIVGEIQDEYDWEERPVEKMRDGSMIVEGTLSAAELREAYGIPLPESGEFETVAGFMLEQLGSVPKGGEVVSVGGWRLTVVDVERNRISKVKVEKLPSPAAGLSSPDQAVGERSGVLRGRRRRRPDRLDPRRLGGPRRRRGRRRGRGRLEEERRALAADEEGAEVLLVDLRPPDDVRGQGHHDVGLLRLVLVLREEPPDERDAREAGQAGEPPPLVVEDEAGEHVGLAVAQADGRVHRAAVEGGQALVARRPHRGDLELEEQRHLPVVVGARGDVDVDADVLVLEGRDGLLGDAARWRSR